VISLLANGQAFLAFMFQKNGFRVQLSDYKTTLRKTAINGVCGFQLLP